jgi:hypothetical protein
MKIKNIQNNQTFRGNLSTKLLRKFVESQEPSNLKYTRFVQDVATNWVPKAALTRSLADFSEMSFLEYTESALFYFVPELFGKIFKKIFPKFHRSNLRQDINKLIPQSASEIVKDKSIDKNIKNRALTTKAAIILACTAIPAAEYALSFAKNLFTLKVFKKSDFNNVVNLNKSKTQVEDKSHQEFVKNSAKHHIKNAGILSAGSLATGLLLARYGHKSSVTSKLSDVIIRPGEYISLGLQKLKLTKVNSKVDKFLKKYITPDFSNDNGNLKLSKGQLLVSTVTGFFGYSSAGKDRGRLDQLEVWSRVPFVVFYTVFGCSIFDHAFKKYLAKHNKFSNLIKRNADGTIADIPLSKDFGKIAEKISGENKEAIEKNLLKQKAIIVGVPYAFGILTMGFLLAGINRFWTQHRYNKQQEKIKEAQSNFKKTPIAFGAFAK